SLREEGRRDLDQGYTSIKIKIAGAGLKDELLRVEAALSLLPGGARLAVDANGRLSRESAIAYATALNQYSLLWFEEPGDPLDFELNREIAAVSTNPIATGENL